MGALALRFRSLLIGIVCLLLSAGLVFAGGGFEFLGDSDGATGGSAPAVTENGDGEDADNHGDLVSQAAQMDTPEPAEGAEGFKNHGAFVSCVAKLSYGKKGSEAPADFVLAELTPEDCGQTEADAEAEAEATADDVPGKSDQAKGKGHGKGKGRGRGG